MKTMQAEHQTDMERIASDQRTVYERLSKELVQRHIEMAKRDKATIQWMVGMAVAGVVLIIGVLGFLIRFPTPSAV